MDDKKTVLLTDEGKLQLAIMLSYLYEKGGYDLSRKNGLWEAAAFIKANSDDPVLEETKAEELSVEEIAVFLVFGVEAWNMLTSSQE